MKNSKSKTDNVIVSNSKDVGKYLDMVDACAEFRRTNKLSIARFADLLECNPSEMRQAENYKPFPTIASYENFIDLHDAIVKCKYDPTDAQLPIIDEILSRHDLANLKNEIEGFKLRQELMQEKEEEQGHFLLVIRFMMKNKKYKENRTLSILNESATYNYINTVTRNRFLKAKIASMNVLVFEVESKSNQAL